MRRQALVAIRCARAADRVSRSIRFASVATAAQTGSALTAIANSCLSGDSAPFASCLQTRWRAETPRGITAFDRDARAAVARARADGAHHVFLVGASFGGVVALTYGVRLPLAGVISMSGETSLFAMNAVRGVARLRTPLLILGSRQDYYLTVPEARQLLRRAGSKDKRLALFAGGFHGWDLVERAPYAPSVRALVLNW